MQREEGTCTLTHRLNIWNVFEDAASCPSVRPDAFPRKAIKTSFVMMGSGVRISLAAPIALLVASSRALGFEMGGWLAQDSENSNS
jgi:hypothetical protein